MIDGDIGAVGHLDGAIGGHGLLEGGINAGGGGTSDYWNLIHKPSINGHTLINDSDYEDIGLHFMTNVELQQLLGGNNNG